MCQLVLQGLIIGKDSGKQEYFFSFNVLNYILYIRLEYLFSLQSIVFGAGVHVSRLNLLFTRINFEDTFKHIVRMQPCAIFMWKHKKYSFLV